MGLPTEWERTGLVARTVFKIAEAVARRLVGSIPTRSRHNTYATRDNEADGRSGAESRAGEGSA